MVRKIKSRIPRRGSRLQLHFLIRLAFARTAFTVKKGSTRKKLKLKGGSATPARFGLVYVLLIILITGQEFVKYLMDVKFINVKICFVTKVAHI